MVAALHFTEGALTLHLLLERLQRLIDVVIANENLYQDLSPVAEYQTRNRPPALSRREPVLKRRRADSKTPRSCPLLGKLGGRSLRA